MRFPAKATSILFLTIATVNVSASPIPASYFDSLLPVDKRGGVGVEVVTYANMARYARFSSAAYHSICPKPAGKTLVKQVRSSAIGSKVEARLDVVLRSSPRRASRALRVSSRSIKGETKLLSRSEAVRISLISLPVGLPTS
jgi:hypothetical protein